MQGVKRHTAALLLLVLVTFSAAAQVNRTPPKEDRAPDLAPGTARTKDQAAESVKEAPGVKPMPMAEPVDPKTYVIGPEDILSIHVWREEQLSTGAQVRPDGKISLPLVGDIQAAGLTPEQVRDNVIAALTEYILKPVVTVSVRAVMSKKYTITGEVNRSGTFPLVVPITVLEALSNAGGFREFAGTKRITILRKGKIINFNHNEVVRGKKLEQNIMVENGDHIHVP